MALIIKNIYEPNFLEHLKNLLRGLHKFYLHNFIYDLELIENEQHFKVFCCIVKWIHLEDFQDF